MYLKKEKSTDKKFNSEYSLEVVADDLVLCAITNEEDSSVSNSYWRLTGTRDVPPLEIGINSETGIIKSITFFIIDDFFAEFEISILPLSEKLLTVNTELFKKPYDFYDLEKTYRLKIVENKLICVFENYNSNNDVKYVGNSEIMYIINENQELCGFCLPELQESHIKCIEKVTKMMKTTNI